MFTQTDVSMDYTVHTYECLSYRVAQFCCCLLCT